MNLTQLTNSKIPYFSKLARNSNYGQKLIDIRKRSISAKRGSYDKSFAQTYHVQSLIIQEGSTLQRVQDQFKREYLHRSQGRLPDHFIPFDIELQPQIIKKEYQVEQSKVGRNNDLQDVIKNHQQKYLTQPAMKAKPQKQKSHQRLQQIPSEQILVNPSEFSFCSQSVAVNSQLEQDQEKYFSIHEEGNKSAQSKEEQSFKTCFQSFQKSLSKNESSQASNKRFEKVNIKQSLNTIQRTADPYADITYPELIKTTHMDSTSHQGVGSQKTLQEVEGLDSKLNQQSTNSNMMINTSQISYFNKSQISSDYQAQASVNVNKENFKRVTIFMKRDKPQSSCSASQNASMIVMSQHYESLFDKTQYSSTSNIPIMKLPPKLPARKTVNKQPQLVSDQFKEKLALCMIENNINVNRKKIQDRVNKKMKNQRSKENVMHQNFEKEMTLQEQIAHILSKKKRL